MIKRQDVVLLLKFIANPDALEWPQKKLAEHLCMSVSTINESLKRLIEVHLIVWRMSIENDKYILVKRSVYEFIVQGVKYIFPQELHGMTSGIPTGYAALMITSASITDPIQVWPYAEGTHRGLSSTPIYSSVPKSISKFKDQRFYDLLCLLDVLRSRLSHIREIDYATDLLNNAILGMHENTQTV